MISCGWAHGNEARVQVCAHLCTCHQPSQSSLAVADEQVCTKWPLDILHERERARWAHRFALYPRVYVLFSILFRSHRFLFFGSGIYCKEVKPKAPIWINHALRIQFFSRIHFWVRACVCVAVVAARTVNTGFLQWNICGVLYITLHFDCFCHKHNSYNIFHSDLIATFGIHLFLSRQRFRLSIAIRAQSVCRSSCALQTR